MRASSTPTSERPPREPALGRARRRPSRPAAGGARGDARGRAGRDARARRGERRRQDDAPARDRRCAPTARRPHLVRRRGRHERPCARAGETRHRARAGGAARVRGCGRRALARAGDRCVLWACTELRLSWVNAVVHGILLGGFYALLAAGLSLMFGVMRIINLAHGSLALVGAYMAYLLLEHAQISTYLALVPVLPGALIVGYGLQRTLLDRSLRAGELVPLLTTFGLLIVIANLLQYFFSPDVHGLSAGGIGPANWRISSSLTIPWFDVLVLGIAIGVLSGRHLLLRRTQIGRELRATAADPDTAELVGVNARAVYARATALAVAVAALAGVFYAMRASFDPFSGPTQLIYAFEAVVIGGMGSLWGTLVGGIVLGVAQTVSAQIDVQYFQLGGHLVFLAVLVLRAVGQVFELGLRLPRGVEA